MAIARLALPVCAVCVAALLLPAARADAATEFGDMPTIEEMLAVAEAGEAAEGDPADEPAEAKPGRGAVRPPRMSASAMAVVKKLERRVQDLYGIARRQRLNWEVVQLFIRVEKFRQAEAALRPMLKSRDPGRNQARDIMDRAARFELEYARVMTYLGNRKMADAYLAEHKRKYETALSGVRPGRISRPWVREALQIRYRFIEGFPAARAEVDALLGALAGEPDAGKQWQLAHVCDPEEEKAVLGLTWMTAILDMIEKHPEDEVVTSGSAHWQLQRAYRYHGMFQDAIALLESFPEDFPRSKHAVRNNHAWELGLTYEESGVLQEAMHDRQGAVADWRRALDSFERFKADYPEDPRNRETEVKNRTRPPVVNRQMDRIMERLQVGGGG